MEEFQWGKRRGMLTTGKWCNPVSNMLHHVEKWLSEDLAREVYPKVFSFLLFFHTPAELAYYVMTTDRFLFIGLRLIFFYHVSDLTNSKKCKKKCSYVCLSIFVLRSPEVTVTELAR